MKTNGAPPIISLEALRGGGIDEGVADAMHRACLDTGFFVAVDHGLEPDITELFDLAHSFFALPAATKHLIPRQGQYGFVPHSSQALEEEDRNSDNTEYLDLGLGSESPFPEIAGFESAVRSYQAAALELATAVMRHLAFMLDSDPDFFTSPLGSPECKLRFLHYPPEPLAADGSLPVPTTPHTDYGLITLLATDGVPGLEVKPIGADWTPVVAPAKSLVVNLGDMLARWTNDRYRSTPHRVVGPQTGERYSIPFFINPAPGTIIDCIPSCVSPARPCRYGSITAGDFLAHRRSSSIEPYIDVAPTELR